MRRNEEQGQSELKAKLAAFPYRGQAIPQSLTVSAETPTIDYFKQFPGLDAGPAYEGPGFWELPIPVMNSIDVDLRDVVIYDGEGYPALRDFLKKQGVRHVLLTGLQHRHVRLLDDGRLQKPVARLRRVSGRRCDHRHLPGTAHAAVRDHRRRSALPHSTCSSRRPRGSSRFRSRRSIDDRRS